MGEGAGGGGVRRSGRRRTLDLLHGRLSRQRELQDLVLVQLVDPGHRAPQVLGVAQQAERLRPVELRLEVHLGGLLRVGADRQGLGGLLRLVGRGLSFGRHGTCRGAKPGSERDGALPVWWQGLATLRGACAAAVVSTAEGLRLQRRRCCVSSGAGSSAVLAEASLVD